MSDENEYPIMLYQGGDLAGANFIAKDAEEEKIANEGRFTRHGQAGSGAGTDLTATQLKEELTKLGVEFKGNASRDYLQGLYDEALAKAGSGAGTGGEGSA